MKRENKDLRISFDTNIRTRRSNLSLEYGDAGQLLLDSETYIMEVKTSLSYPLWLTEILSELELKRTSFSKYGTEFKQYLLKGNCQTEILNYCEECSV